MMITILLQIVFSGSYYILLIKVTILVSSLLSIFFMSLLSMRFISWYQVSKNRTLLLFSSSTIAMMANSMVIIIFSYFALLNVQQVMNPSIPSFTNMMFNLPGLKIAYLSTTTIEFILIWIASVFILKPYSSRIGTIRFWSLMIIPIVFFTTKFQFYQFWLSSLLISNDLLSPVSYFRFVSIFELSTNVIGALVFGVAYWIVSTRIKDKSLRQFIQISGIGVCLLFLSSQITNLTLLPYPPFGLASISFASISGYLLFIGLYQSAIITSKDSVIRSLIHKSAGNELRFIGNIGSSEMKHNITSQFREVVKKYGDELEDSTSFKSSDPEKEAKSFVAMALQEREIYLRNATVRRLYSREDSPLGRPWEKWVESWWQWCYSFKETDNPVADSTGQFSKYGQVSDSVWFLAGTFGGKVERTCKIPREFGIFFPILNNIISYHTDPQLKTQSELETYAKCDLDRTNFISANIDGQDIPDLYSYRVHSELFSINVPSKKNKHSQVKTEAVSDGYWLFLKSLSPGKHIIKFAGEKLEFDKIEDYRNILDDEIKNLPRFRVEVTYKLEIT